MRTLTDEELTEACRVANGTQDVTKASDLNLSNKELSNVKVLSSATNLCSLNMAFNKLRSASSISPLLALKTLNISHNNISDLEPLAALRNLWQLRCSHNKITDLSPCGQMPALRELWVQSNAITEIKTICSLAAAKDLSTLVLRPNPCCSDSSVYRPTIVRILPNLEVLDALAVSDQDRAAAAKLPAHKAAVSRDKKEQKASTTLRRPISTSLSRPTSNSSSKSSGRRSASSSRGSVHESRDDDDSADETVSLQSLNHNAEPADIDVPDSNHASPTDLSPREVLSASSSPTRSSTKSLSLSCNQDYTPVENPSFESIALMLPDLSSIFVSSPRKIISKEFIVPHKENKAVAAVTVRLEGSAMAKYPNNQLAISVDSTPDGFRLFAAYRKTGTVAASFDHRGNGIVNCPDGSTMYSHSTERGGYWRPSGKGAPVDEWGSNGSFKVPLRAKLDDHLAFALDSPTDAVRLFYCYGDVKHMFKNESNPQQACWDSSTCSGLGSGTTKAKRSSSYGRANIQPVEDIRKATSNLPNFGDHAAKRDDSRLNEERKVRPTLRPSPKAQAKDRSKLEKEQPWAGAEPDLDIEEIERLRELRIRMRELTKQFSQTPEVDRMEVIAER